MDLEILTCGSGSCWPRCPREPRVGPGLPGTVCVNRRCARAVNERVPLSHLEVVIALEKESQEDYSRTGQIASHMFYR